MKPILQILSFIIIFISCKNTISTGQVLEGPIIPGAERTDLYLPLLKNTKVGLIVNQTSIVKNKHLVDYLTEQGVQVVKIFTPEHGFRGEADAGQKLNDEIDSNTGLPIISLYGKKKKPSPQDLAGIETLIFDIQDVGVRFYTYISTLHYVMEAAAESGLTLMLLDRPNPLSDYIDGPVLDTTFQSFVGMHPVPVVYGMTIGEYAQMINGEGWLKNGIKCPLKVIPIDNYNHQKSYILPIKPSPNLPNNIAIGHYPSLCFFEGTTVSVGRGTAFPFQVAGHPGYRLSEKSLEYSFTPQPTQGAKYPKHEKKRCLGVDLQRVKPAKRIDLSYLINFYNNLSAHNKPFFNDNNFFDLLAGTDQLKKQIISGISEGEIRASWAGGLLEFKFIRKKYLLYVNTSH